MQITIPEILSDRLRQLANRHQKSVESIIVDRLFTALDDELDQLPNDEQAELRALHHLSDDALQAIASEQMTSANQAMMQDLMQKNSTGTISFEEKEMLTALVQRGEQLMLRKAEAFALLRNRNINSKTQL